MSHRRLAPCVAALTLAACALLGPALAGAQQAPADLTVLPPVPTSYVPKKTPWGDPDFRGTWPLENINVAHIPFQRPTVFGARFWVNDGEFAQRLKAAKASDGAYSTGLNSKGTTGLAHWTATAPFARRTSMLVDPADGQLPPMTPHAEALYKAGRSSWVKGQAYDSLTDFDTWDLCISRGFPASMMPFHYNNGVRVFQSPGFVEIHLEMLGDRIIPIGRAGHWPRNMEAWMGSSRGRWKGRTLVIETANIKSGDGATRDFFKRAASPLNTATQGVPPNNSIPTSTQARAVERLTMTGPDTITYELTYTDPEVFTAPWTARFDWTRDETYQMYEYACHEGNGQLRDHIMASRAERAQAAPAAKAAGGG